MFIVSLLTAEGFCNRMNRDIPKHFLTANGRSIIMFALETFQNHPEINAIAVVCISDWKQVLWAYAKQFTNVEDIDIFKVPLMTRCSNWLKNPVEGNYLERIVIYLLSSSSEVSS